MQQLQPVSQRPSLSLSDRLQQTYVIGSTGTGKSTLLLRMIMHDIDTGQGVCVLDPHGDLICDVIKRMQGRFDEVILLSLTNDTLPFGLNLYQCPYPSDIKWVQYTVNQVMHVFERLYGISQSTPQMLWHMLNCTHTIIANPGYTMAEIPRLLTDATFRATLLIKVTDPSVRLFWSEYEKVVSNRYEYLREVHPILNKLGQFLQPMLRNIVGQAKSTISLPQIMDQGKILLVKLDARMEDMTTLIGATMIAQILNAAYARANMTNRRQFHVYIDEFQRFTTEDMGILLTEARKYQLSLVLANQTIAQLPESIKSAALAAGTVIVYRLSGEDSKVLASTFNCTPPPPVQEESGRRKKQAPVKDVVQNLLSKGSHQNPLVNQFALNTLSKLSIVYTNGTASENKAVINGLNWIFHTAMTQTPPPLAYTEEVLFSLFSNRYITIYYLRELCLQEQVRQLLTSLLHTNGSAYTHSLQTLTSLLKNHIQAIEFGKLEQLVRDVEGEFNSAYHTSHYDRTVWPKVVDPIQYFSAKEQAGGKFTKQLFRHVLVSNPPYTYQDDWYDFKPSQLLWEYPKQQIGQLGRWTIKPGQDMSRFYSPTLLENTVSREVQEEIAQLQTFLTEVKQVMAALAHNPILGDSGEEEVIYRPGPVRTYADMENEIANTLTTLPNYTARIKTPSGEHTVVTSPARPPVSEAEFETRVRWIQWNNLRLGYVRKREDVEAEIARRQPVVLPTPPPQAQVSPQNNRQPTKKPIPITGRRTKI